MKKILFLGTLLALLLTACGPTVAPTQSVDRVSTMVAETMQAITAAAPTATPVPSGMSVSGNGTAFIIPNGLANGISVSSTTEVELPYINPSFGDMPLHTVIHLDNYAIKESRLQPEIMVFRVAEYTQYTEKTAQIIADLQNLQYTAGQPLPENLKDGVFQAQVQPVQFQNGKGLRYVVQFDQALLPANNKALYYYFHGITSDGQYYVQAFLPINAPFLVADDQPTSITPPDGVQFDWSNSSNSYENFTVYRDAVNQKLNAADPVVFNPTLQMLDGLIQSMTVSTP